MRQDNDIASIEMTCQETGLNFTDVQSLRKQYGYNEIPEKQMNPLRGILKRLWGPIPWLLEAAMIFELLMDKIVQSVIVLVLLLFSAVIGEIQEKRAKKAIGFLHHKLEINVRVLRDGMWQIIPSRELIPGDIIHLKIGDIVPADATIISGSVSVNQSALTGESVDVVKQINETVFSASTISHGELSGCVTEIGVKSSYGKTADLVRTAEAPGRLQVLLFTIVRYLAYLDLILAVILVITAYIKGTSWQELLPFLVILFIATIPISMPSSFTVANSLEAKKLAKSHVLITGLTGIQEAATMNVLLVDKTGTLTYNRPEIAEIVTFNQIETDDLLKLAAAASDDAANDTISTAIFRALKDKELTIPERISYTPFDPVMKVSKAQVIYQGIKQKIVFGSPVIINQIASVPLQFMNQYDALSSKGSRVLAVASGEDDNLVCQGLIAFADFPRSDAKETIAEFHKLGIRVMMITGDTFGTAKAIAEQVGLGNQIGTLADALSNPLAFDGFANVYPEDKYTIVKSLQKLGMIVGMTGDGINDAPALKQADIGIAVSTATDVAKTAAKVVLTEPNLSDIIKVIDGGHRVYRRMMTWTITKLARTAELAALLTFGFIFTGFFPVSLNLIVFIIVMNDMVTLTLGTDKAWPTSVPEKWNVSQLAKISAIFTIGWLAFGLGLLWYYIKYQTLDNDQINSLMFLYLIFSAMETILMTRNRDSFWLFLPSKWVSGMVIVNIIVAILMASFGWVMAVVKFSYIITLFIFTLIVMFILDGLKMWYYKKTGILGTERHSKI